MKKNKILTSAIILGTMIFGTLNVNAATTYAEKLPDTVTRKNRDSEYYFMQSGIRLQDGKTNSVIEFMSNDDKYLLYCSDRNNPNTDHQTTLTKGQKMNHKIAYALSYRYRTGDLISGITHSAYTQAGETPENVPDNKANEMANIWITQLSVWNLQGTISENDIENSQVLAYTLKNTTQFTLKSGSNNIVGLTLWPKVQKLVADANNAQNPEEAALKVEGSKEWTKSDNISKSGLITISSTSSLAQVSNYSLSLDNAPEGTKVYKEDGTEITNNATNIPGGTKIYITVDNNKLDKSKEYNFKLNAKANIIYDAAYQYVDNSNQCNGQACQPSVLVGPETKDIQGSLDLKIIPDTASSLSKSIYYIGFIVLLCGVGMIYANVRPKRQEEE